MVLPFSKHELYVCRDLLSRTYRIKLMPESTMKCVCLTFLYFNRFAFLNNRIRLPEVGRSATCSAMRISATCATRKFAADVRFNLQAADYGIAPAHLEI